MSPTVVATGSKKSLTASSMDWVMESSDIELPRWCGDNLTGRGGAGAARRRHVPFGDGGGGAGPGTGSTALVSFLVLHTGG
ncbi:hypothetical protein GCM10010247_33730 [Streptomyces calvus]|nr:hypothetical protein GCM10010247_33730 [Streptomyces calvus]